MSTQTVRVYCRIRPFNNREKALGNLVHKPIRVMDTEIEIEEKGKVYSFDQNFDEEASQLQVFNVIGRAVVDDFLEGFNATQFVYGQTGAGKSWTMMGVRSDENLCGIIPRSCALLFQRIMEKPQGWKFSIEASYLEIYMERVNDLLDATKENLDVKETKDKGVFVPGLTKETVTSLEDIFDILDRGDNVRKIASTQMNSTSSRSHSVFSIYLEQTTPTGAKLASQLNLVDLAGSERIDKTGATGEVLKQGTLINLSLTVLSQVIAGLSKIAGGGGSAAVPYRESKLTRLLQTSLGGDAKTGLSIHCSPHIDNLDESISTLEFGKRAKLIKNHAKAKVRKSADQLERELDALSRAYEELKEAFVGLVGGGDSGQAMLQRVLGGEDIMKLMVQLAPPSPSPPTQQLPQQATAQSAANTNNTETTTAAATTDTTTASVENATSTQNATTNNAPATADNGTNATNGEEAPMFVVDEQVQARARRDRAQARRASATALEEDAMQIATLMHSAEQQRNSNDLLKSQVARLVEKLETREAEVRDTAKDVELKDIEKMALQSKIRDKNRARQLAEARQAQINKNRELARHAKQERQRLREEARLAALEEERRQKEEEERRLQEEEEERRLLAEARASEQRAAIEARRKEREEARERERIERERILEEKRKQREEAIQKLKDDMEKQRLEVLRQEEEEKARKEQETIATHEAEVAELNALIKKQKGMIKQAYQENQALIEDTREVAEQLADKTRRLALAEIKVMRYDMARALLKSNKPANDSPAGDGSARLSGDQQSSKPPMLGAKGRGLTSNSIFRSISRGYGLSRGAKPGSFQQGPKSPITEDLDQPMPPPLDPRPPKFERERSNSFDDATTSVEKARKEALMSTENYQLADAQLPPQPPSARKLGKTKSVFSKLSRRSHGLPLETPDASPQSVASSWAGGKAPPTPPSSNRAPDSMTPTMSISSTTPPSSRRSPPNTGKRSASPLGRMFGLSPRKHSNTDGSVSPGRASPQVLFPQGQHGQATPEKGAHEHAGDNTSPKLKSTKSLFGVRLSRNSTNTPRTALETPKTGGRARSSTGTPGAPPLPPSSRK